MGTNSADEEFMHFSVDANKVHWSIVLAGAICILLAVYAGSKDQLLPLDNYGTQKGWFLRQRSKFTNSTLFLSEATDAQKKTHPLHKLYKKKLIRYDYGTSFANHCKLKVKPNGSLPSPARVLEMKIASQVLLRLAVLLGFPIKFFLCLIRNESILLLSGRGFLCRLQPVIELLSSVVLLLMTCLHQEQDQSVKWLMPYNFPTFSCLFILGGIMYLNLDVLDLSKKFSAVRFSVQLSCLLAYCICAPTVHSSLLQYLKERPCHVYVPYQSAMAEYVCISSFLMFSASQLGDLHGLRIVVPSLPNTPTINSSTRYSPAFLAPDSSPENSVKVSLS